MNVPLEIIGIFLTAGIGLQGWTLIEVVSLKTKMAALEQRFQDLKK